MAISRAIVAVNKEERAICSRGNPTTKTDSLTTNRARCNEIMTSAGKYKLALLVIITQIGEQVILTKWLCRPFRPNGGFKRDRRDGQNIQRQNKQPGKHIDLNALRNNGNPIREDRGGKKMFNKKKFRKGGRPDMNNKKGGKKPVKLDANAQKEALDRQMEAYWVKNGDKSLGKSTHTDTPQQSKI